MATQQNSMFGMAPQQQPPMGTPPANLFGIPAPNTQQPQQPQQPMLGTTPTAGPQLQGGNYYNSQATNAVRDYFKLWNDDQFGTDTAALEQQLRNRGIRPTDPAYATELNNLRDQQGKMRESSNIQAILNGGSEAQRMQTMDNTAANSNLDRQLAVAGNTRSETELRRDAQRYNDDKSAGYVGMGLDLLDRTGVLGKVGNGLFGLADKGIDAASAGVNNLTNGATTGLLTKGAGMLGLGGGASAGAINAGLAGTQLAGLGGELAVATNAAAPGLSAALGGGAPVAAGGGTGIGATLTGLATNPVTWAVAGALAAGLVLDKNLPSSSPLDKFDTGSGAWTKGENFAGTQFSPEELNGYYGPAIQTFMQTGDARQALAALQAPQDAKQKLMAEKAYHLFNGTGNPFRQIAKANGFGEGVWTAGHSDKKKLIEEIKGAA